MTTIRARLLATIGVAVALTLAGAGLVVYVLARASLHEQFDSALVASARALAQLVEYDDNDGLEADLAPDAVPGDAFELWDSNGESIVRSSALGAAHLSRTPAPTSSLVVRAVTLPDGRTARQVELAFPPRQERGEQPVYAEQPRVTLALASVTAGVDATVAQIRTIVIAVAIGATLICLLLVAWAITYGLRPARAVAAQIAAIDVAHLSQRLDSDAVPAELRPITTTLDELTGRLERAFTRERELTAEVAHELRTPLAGLRTSIEVARGRERSPERYREVLDECLAIVAQTERMVETLLSLARLDAGRDAGRDEDVSLDTLVRDAVGMAAERAAAHGRRFELQLDAATVRGDREALRRVVDNLVDNAIAYAEGELVQIETTPTGELRVRNATSLAPDQAARVFERFWRADPARAAGAHAGLGLALCKKLVERGGGTINAAVEDGQFVLSVSLPM